MNNQTKKQLLQCVLDLSNRFGELGDRNTQANLLIIAASISEGGEDMLSEWMATYAEMRLAMERGEEGA
jgi:hypothetical protein